MENKSPKHSLHFLSPHLASSQNGSTSQPDDNPIAKQAKLRLGLKPLLTTDPYMPFLSERVSVEGPPGKSGKSPQDHPSCPREDGTSSLATHPASNSVDHSGDHHDGEAGLSDPGACFTHLPSESHLFPPWSRPVLLHVASITTEDTTYRWDQIQRAWVDPNYSYFPLQSAWEYGNTGCSIEVFTNENYIFVQLYYTREGLWRGKYLLEDDLYVHPISLRRMVDCGNSGPGCLGLPRNWQPTVNYGYYPL